MDSSNQRRAKGGKVLRSVWDTSQAIGYSILHALHLISLDNFDRLESGDIGTCTCRKAEGLRGLAHRSKAIGVLVKRSGGGTYRKHEQCLRRPQRGSRKRCRKISRNRQGFFMSAGGNEVFHSHCDHECVCQVPTFPAILVQLLEHLTVRPKCDID
ncbi:hypothetical protein FAGKG844_550036 [Frankia sp. AgKG'84/4]